MENLFDDPMIREIYRRGVRDAYEIVCAHLSIPQCRVMEDWMTELDLWNDGNPPRVSKETPA
jgi:hypothetical protein